MSTTRTTRTAPITTRLPTTIPISTNTKAIVTTTKVGSSTTTTRGSKPYNGGSASTVHLSTAAAIAISVALVLIVALVLVFVWHQRNKRRRARNLPRATSFTGSESPHPNSEFPEPEKGEAGNTSGAVPVALLPSRSPAGSIHGQGAGSESESVGYRPVYVERTVPVPGPWVPGANNSNPGSTPHPHSLPSPYEPPWAPPPHEFSAIPTRVHAQKETHLPGSHRDDT